MQILLVLFFCCLPSLAVGSNLHCEGEDAGVDWAYEIALEGGRAEIAYSFSDWRSDHVSELSERGIKVPSPLEFLYEGFLVRTVDGWDIQFWNYDGTQSGYLPEEFFCIESQNDIALR